MWILYPVVSGGTDFSYYRLLKWERRRALFQRQPWGDRNHSQSELGDQMPPISPSHPDSVNNDNVDWILWPRRNRSIAG